MSMKLAEVVTKYLDAARGYGKAVPLSALGLSKEEIEEVFSVFDEDYHISRFFQFSHSSGTEYQIDGFPQTHVSIDSEVQSIL
ncbi:MAG TPA: hypothetical protein VG322_17135 [Candidatus Acidoferrales bacterium]|jgi:hypothetical protein|nr:hypothetical protein [Candidatus Acidoferrales bacterium]